MFGGDSLGVGVSRGVGGAGAGDDRACHVSRQASSQAAASAWSSMGMSFGGMGSGMAAWPPTAWQLAACDHTIQSLATHLPLRLQLHPLTLLRTPLNSINDPMPLYSVVEIDVVGGVSFGKGFVLSSDVAELVLWKVDTFAVQRDGSRVDLKRDGVSEMSAAGSYLWLLCIHLPVCVRSSLSSR